MEFIRRNLVRYKTCAKLQQNRYYKRNFCSKVESSDAGEWPRRVVSGIQPTGALHVGNYFGVIRRCVQLQEQNEDLMLFIADLHSLTTYIDPLALQENILDLTAFLLASGVDPERSVVFAQSDVSRHAELCWMLACLATQARLAHLPQYKEKSARVRELSAGLLLYTVLQAVHVLAYRGMHAAVGADQLQHLQIASQPSTTDSAALSPRRDRCLGTRKKCQYFLSIPCPYRWLVRLYHLYSINDQLKVPAGLLLYPVLQAADVLAYRGTHVPIGADQLQHLQIASQLVRTFHHRYGHAFPTPRPLLPDDGSDRLRSLRDPSKKMSKSDADIKSRILLSDSDDVIRLKIRKAVTDFTPQVTYEPESRAGVSNLVMLHCLARGLVPEEAVAEAEGLTTAAYKALVADAVCDTIGPVRERAAALRERPALLRDVLRHGAARARARADAVYEDVARLVGLAPRRHRKLTSHVVL